MRTIMLAATLLILFAGCADLTGVTNGLPSELKVVGDRRMTPAEVQRANTWYQQVSECSGLPDFSAYVDWFYADDIRISGRESYGARFYDRIWIRAFDLDETDQGFANIHRHEALHHLLGAAGDADGDHSDAFWRTCVSFEPDGTQTRTEA